uniref:Uncharacterized protein n=1 Tax=Pelusios castaneus TaxID=367368 RepID=A0A8C8RNY2_9SAUR
MKSPRRCCSEEGLLQVTILLSLAGLRLDLDLSLLRAPAGSFHASWVPPGAAWLAGCSPPHPKCPEQDWGDPASRQRLLLLREVRALGGPYIPSTRVDAWLVHAVAGEGHGALPSPGSGAGGAGPSETSTQEPRGQTRSARGSSLQQQAGEEGDGGASAGPPGGEAAPGGSDCPAIEVRDSGGHGASLVGWGLEFRNSWGTHGAGKVEINIFFFMPFLQVK